MTLSGTSYLYGKGSIVNEATCLYCIGSVFSVSASSSQLLACSGGEDDLGVVWSMETGQAHFQCTGDNQRKT